MVCEHIARAFLVSLVHKFLIIAKWLEILDQARTELISSLICALFYTFLVHFWVPSLSSGS